MRWKAQSTKAVWDFRRRFAWYPMRVEYAAGPQWVWLETVEVQLYVNEGGGTSWIGRGYD
jgi:hypothetical protein